MITLSYKDNNLIVHRTTDITFNIGNDSITNVIKLHLNKFGGTATINLNKIKNGYILSMNNSIKLRLDERTGFEIYSRIH